MTIEELLQLKKPELQKLAAEKGIEYNSKTTNAELAEMIHAENAKNENADVSQTVATQVEKNDDVALGNGIFVVPGQTIMVRERQEGGELIEKELPFDAVLSIDHIELGKKLAQLEQENANQKQTILVLGNDNRGLVVKIDEQESLILELKKKNIELELRAIATGVDLSLGSDVGLTHEHPSSQKPVWNSEAETMKVRVRITPNKGITSRIRSGMQFGVQYSEHEIDEATFNALIADSHLQVEALDE